MARKSQTTEARFNTVLADYKQKFNVDSLDSPNDIANLHTMIRNQIIIEKLQNQMHELTEQDEIDPIAIKKILDSLVALSESNVIYERTLGIDRKTRKQETAESVADFLQSLKARAKEWLDDDDRILKVICPRCKIMVGRISGVYNTTRYDAGFQCPQCNKMITVKRAERDVFYDVRDSEWRRKYPIEIEQPKRTRAPELNGVEDDLIIGDTIEFGEDE